MLLVRLEKFASGAGPARQDVALRSVGGLVAKEIERAHRRVRKQGRKVHAEPTPEELHGLRTRAKRLRYTLELCRDLTGRDGRKAIRRLVKLQDLLGTFHDAVVAADFVRQYVEGPGKRAGSASLITLGAFLGQELRRAEDMRRDFARTWKSFERKRTRRQFEAIIRRLRKDNLLQTAPVAQTPSDSASLEVMEVSSRSTSAAPASEASTVSEPMDIRPLDERRPLAKRGVVENGEPKVATGGYREP
jgi:hypothetical protein